MKRYLEINLDYQPPAVVLQLSGELGPLSHIDLLEAGQAAAGSDLPLVILDFSGVEYMNSAGLSGLIQLLARLGSRGQTIYACGLSSHDRLVFEVMRLTDTFKLAEDIPAALNDHAKINAPGPLPPPEPDHNPEVDHERPAI